MLLAVEGGGFFSSSATGYSNGLTLLILGHRHEERTMRVSPWNQYQLVDHEVQSESQLASRRKHVSTGCTSFICFRRTSSEPDGSSALEAVGPVRQPEALIDDSPPPSQRCEIHDNVSADQDKKNVLRKSSLKKQPADCSVVIGAVDEGCNAVEEAQSNEVCSAERRRVHWIDACGRELAEIREFEVSDELTTDEGYDHDGGRRCQCVIQ